MEEEPIKDESVKTDFGTPPEGRGPIPEKEPIRKDELEIWLQKPEVQEELLQDIETNQ